MRGKSVGEIHRDLPAIELRGEIRNATFSASLRLALVRKTLSQGTIRWLRGSAAFSAAHDSASEQGLSSVLEEGSPQQRAAARFIPRSINANNLPFLEHEYAYTRVSVLAITRFSRASSSSYCNVSAMTKKKGKNTNRRSRMI